MAEKLGEFFLASQLDGKKPEHKKIMEELIKLLKADDIQVLDVPEEFAARVRKKEVQNWIKNQGDYLLLIEAGELIGYIQFQKEYDKLRLQIARTFVRKDKRRKGLSLKMRRRLDALARHKWKLEGLIGTGLTHQYRKHIKETKFILPGGTTIPFYSNRRNGTLEVNEAVKRFKKRRILGK